MHELTASDLKLKLQEDLGAYAVFFYTPMCGTCQLAERMLNIILEMKPQLPIFKSNLYYLHEVSQTWKIESVPCIFIMEHGELLCKVYAMKSVDELYRLLRPIMNGSLID